MIWRRESDEGGVSGDPETTHADTRLVDVEVAETDGGGPDLVFDESSECAELSCLLLWSEWPEEEGALCRLEVGDVGEFGSEADPGGAKGGTGRSELPAVR